MCLSAYWTVANITLHLQANRKTLILLNIQPNRCGFAHSCDLPSYPCTIVFLILLFSKNTINANISCFWFIPIILNYHISIKYSNNQTNLPNIHPIVKQTHMLWHNEGKSWNTYTCLEVLKTNQSVTTQLYLNLFFFMYFACLWNTFTGLVEFGFFYIAPGFCCFLLIQMLKINQT